MSKFNIGHLSGVTVNTTEKLVDKVKKDVPAATHATKRGMKGWKDSVKAEYKKAREGVVEAEVIDSPVTTNSYGHGSAQQNAFRVFELTTGR
jgi:hypothetical protein